MLANWLVTGVDLLSRICSCDPLHRNVTTAKEREKNHFVLTWLILSFTQTTCKIGPTTTSFLTSYVMIFGLVHDANELVIIPVSLFKVFCSMYMH